MRRKIRKGRYEIGREGTEGLGNSWRMMMNKERICGGGGGGGQEGE
jgi:hypothetical protein